MQRRTGGRDLASQLTQVDRESLRQTGKPIDVPGSIDQIVGRDDNVWVLDSQVGTVTRIDTVSRTVGRSGRIGDEATDMAVGLGAAWITDAGGSLYRVDALTLDVQEFPLGAEVLGVGVDENAGTVWVYLGKAIAPAGG
jgi:streptogramin lyase